MSVSSPTRPVLRYHGGKWKLGPWILAHLPAHRIYVEPFCGAASVLLRKPRSKAEVLNDVDGEIVNVFRVLRDPAQARELARLVHLTPYARSEFQSTYLPDGDPIEQARRTIARSFMGFGSAAHNAKHRTGFRSNSTRSGTTPAHDWMHYPDIIPAFVERLRGVTIDNRTALEVIPIYDHPEALFYADPPYPFSTRSALRWQSEDDRCYVYEMTDDDHRALAEALHAVKGMVVLSGYPCDLYDAELYPNWYRVERRSHADGARDRTEVLWLNARAAAGVNGRFDFGGGRGSE